MNQTEFEEALLSAQICFKSPQSSSIIHAPVTLNPTPFSSLAFQRACQLQPAFNLLVLRTVQNGKLLKKVCAKLAESDEFVANLFKIYTENSHPPSVRIILQ